MVVTGVRYFLLKDGVVIAPDTLAIPEITDPIPSANRESYVIYTETVVSREMLFSVLMVGQVGDDEANEVLEVAKEEWSKLMGKLNINVGNSIVMIGQKQVL